MPAPRANQRRILRLIREGASSIATASGPREISGTSEMTASLPDLGATGNRITIVTGTSALSSAAPTMESMDLMEEIRQDMVATATPFIGTGTGAAPGMVIGFVTPDHGEFSFGLGEKSIGGAAPDGDTLFCLGSVTKTMTAYVLAKAKVDGDVTLATSANSLLDSSPDDIRIPGHNDITLQYLAAHTSGLLSYPDNLDPANFQSLPGGVEYTKSDLATSLAAGDSNVTPPAATPGNVQRYSNYGYGLLSICLQNEFGYSNDFDLLDAKVFTPLGMTKTSTNDEPFMTNNAADLAQGYKSDLTAFPFPYMGIMAGAGEFISSANDMMKFVRELAEQASSYSTEMQADISGVSSPAIGYGHTIGTAGDGEELRSKGGNTAAFSSAIAWRENPNIGVVVLTNRGSVPNLVQLAEDLLDDAAALLP
tara:strand:- start:2368 stop:3636 length:1269 start_codon:yes stop_codon:yes gene_type:complete